MSESIQIPPTCCPTLDRTVARREFLVAAATLYDRPLAVAVEELDDLEDTAALLLAFPWLSDAELLEALWSLGRF